MGFFIRKSFGSGPFRINLSKSGLGISTGVKGFRVGKGPRGYHVHMGRGGLYYRKQSKTLIPSPPKAKGRGHRPGLPPAPARLARRSGSQMEATSSAVARQVRDVACAQRIGAIAERYGRPRLAARVAWVAIPATVVAGVYGPLAAVFPVLVAAVPLLLVAAWVRDRAWGKVAVVYDYDARQEALTGQLVEAFVALSQARKVWRVTATASVDPKYHGGATVLHQRDEASVRFGAPPCVATQAPTPSLVLGDQTVHFLPDCLLVYEKAGVGAIDYGHLAIEASEIEYVETGPLPPDAQSAGQTWRHTNKQGGPDRRFRDNPVIPLMRYETLRLSSPSGFQVLLYLSRIGPGRAICDAVRALAASNVGPRTKAPIDRR